MQRFQRRDARIAQQSGRHVSRQHSTGAQRTQGGDRRHESGFDGELCDNPHLADAEGKKRAYLMDA